ncbi:hypothetical protein BZA77DRAFT_143881 [Pyronema omphalodes]|nr:hypothetical protein BZA77DRAFT_143881 [Pyronema omphalodes]
MTDSNQPKHFTDYSSLPKYVFVSIPKDDDALNRLKAALPGDRTVSDFPIPRFESNIGNPTELAKQAEKLKDLDQQATGDIIKIAELLKAVVPNNDAKYKMVEKEPGRKVGATEYLRSFKWDATRYKYSESDALASVISSAVPGAAPSIEDLSNALRSDIIKRAEKVSEAHANYLEASRRNNIRTLPIAHLLNKDDFVQTLKLEIEHEPVTDDHSRAPRPSRIEFFPEYIVTLVAIVPHEKSEDWRQNYSKLKGMEAGMVVPDSSRLLYETKTHKFYSVTLVKKYKDTFIQAAKAEDYIIRDVDWSSADPRAEAQAIIDAEAQSFEEFLELASTAYSELSVALLHTKMLRLYVDSVRRYGPNCRLLSVVVWTNNNEDASDVKDKLYDKFAELGGKAVHYDDKGRIIKHEGEGGKEEEAEGYIPFSCYEMTIV